MINNGAGNATGNRIRVDDRLSTCDLRLSFVASIIHTLDDLIRHSLTFFFFHILTYREDHQQGITVGDSHCVEITENVGTRDSPLHIGVINKW
eukprot:CAMPEP_0115016730 /NCGR_PEP_ID=MMETSP0216-20121206/27643_1 /TAXON_ID=223996 /ORGANISM="Protocruzia adherens, Strain Boccale" /LENGTH=92 /DNA_ID=CAMNT_0002387307 /DNA_START=45 /DNA_END=320 /DNA_ORIENTATION=+